MPLPHRRTPSRPSIRSNRAPIRRLLTLLAIAVTVGSLVVAEPVAASSLTSAASATVATPATRAATDAAITQRLTVTQLVAVETGVAAAPAGFAPISAMPARVQHAAPPPPAAQPAQTQQVKQASNGSTQTGYGCAAALAYLSAHAAPGFTFECPGYAYGRQAMTCVNHAPQCAGRKLIAIAVPCPAAYMNEAHNSWVLTGTGSGIDPYGYCH